MIEEKSRTKLNLFSLLIGIAGFFVSLYALVLHLKILLSPGHGALCDINATFNCSNVISSSYGELASIPLGSYGMTYFMIVISAAILPKVSLVTKKQLAILEFVLSFVGFACVVALFYISHSILKTICPTCSIIHILVTIYFIYSLVTLWKLKNESENNKTQSDYFVRFLAIAICLGTPPLAAGLIAPILLDKYFDMPAANKTKTQSNKIISPTNSSPKKAEASNEKQENNLQEKLRSFNKTNYVGDGEDYRYGSDDAPVIVQVFSDFGCPHCHEANGPLMEAQKQVGLNKVLIVYRFYPLTNKCNPTVPSEGWYPYSCILPQATRCAGIQGKFWEFKDWAFSGQDWSDNDRQQNFSLDGLKLEAKRLGINENTFTQCIQSEQELQKIKNDAELAGKAGIKGTPFILINGKEFTGPHTTDAFIKAFQLD